MGDLTLETTKPWSLGAGCGNVAMQDPVFHVEMGTNNVPTLRGSTARGLKV